MKKKHKINKYTSLVDKKSFKTFLDTIESNHLRDITQNLDNNLDLLVSSLLLPVKFVQSGIESVDFLERFRSASTSLEPEKRNKENIEKEMKRLDDERQMTDISHALDILDKMIEEDEQLAKTMDNLFRLNTLHLWTIFEVFSQDMWISCVNAYPETLGKGAFENKREKCTSQIIKEFFDKKFKIDYELSMGDFLSNYIDFSGVKDITKAYKTAFGDTFKQIEYELTHNIDLMNLQLIRNQVIHKSGIVDKQFKTTANNLNYDIGDIIEIDGKLFKILFESVLRATRLMLEYVDSFISDRN